MINLFIKKVYLYEFPLINNMAKDSRLENEHCLEENCSGSLYNTNIRDKETRQLIYQCNYCGIQYTYDEWFAEFEEKTRPDSGSHEERKKTVNKMVADLKKIEEGEPVDQEAAKANIKGLVNNIGRRENVPHDPEAAKRNINARLGDMGKPPGYLVLSASFNDNPLFEAFVSEAEPKNQLRIVDVRLVGQQIPLGPVTVPVGKYTITAEYNSAYGLLTETKTAIIRSGETTNLEFNFTGSEETLRRSRATAPHPHGGSGPGNIHGHVTDSRGNPLQGVNVHLVGRDLEALADTTDETGYYRIDVGNLKGEFRVAAEIEGFKTRVKKNRRARDDKYQICNFKLESEGATRPTPEPTPPTPGPTSPGEIWGYVQDAKNDRPIPNATVNLPQLNRSTNTDTAGYYIFRDVRRRGATRVTVQATGYSQGSVTISRSHEDESSEVPTFKLNRAGGVPVPQRVSVGLGINFNRLIGSLTSIIIGLIVSALLKNPYFFFGFLFIGASILMPNTEDIGVVQRTMRRIRSQNSLRINQTQNRNDISDQEKIRLIRELVETEQRTLEIERLIGQRMERADRFRVNGILILKHLFKAFGTLSFVLAFVNTGLPFANILALVGAFVGYFAIGGYRLPVLGGGTAEPATGGTT